MADGLTKTNLNAMESSFRAIKATKWRIQYDENFGSGRKKKAALRAKVIQEVKAPNKQKQAEKAEAKAVHLLFFENGTFGLSVDPCISGCHRDQCFDVGQKRFKVR